MANVVIKFPPRFLHPERSVLGREVFRLVEEGKAVNVPQLARLTGANPAVIDRLIDWAVDMKGGVA